jgi:hypothetical protein
MPPQNFETQLSLDDAVEEVLSMLTGLDLVYDPRQDRYRSIARQINRATRAIALEQEWQWFADTTSVGQAVAGDQVVVLSSQLRPRIINDDAVRLVDAGGSPVVWAYILPRDSLHKYGGSAALRCSVVRNQIFFSRPFLRSEDGLDIQVPTMREPKMIRLPDLPQEIDESTGEIVQVPDSIRNQLIDFNYPDLVIAKAAAMYAATDPVMQPRVQTLEEGYKDLMYQLMERDSANTDTPFMNDFSLGIKSGMVSNTPANPYPSADWR